MKKCSRCGTDLLTGQLVCPHCGKPQRKPRKVRCRNCGQTGGRLFQVCPTCGEQLKRDWIHPILLVTGIAVGIALTILVVPMLWQAVSNFQPVAVVSTVQAVASEVPVFVQVPTLTPSLTPSVTPTPTNTPTVTPTPSRTPSPTLTPTATPTPTPTETPTPTLTPTKVYPTWTPKPKATPTTAATPVPTVQPPAPVEPENGAPFSGEGAKFKLAWQSAHTLRVDEYFEVRVRYTHQGIEEILPVALQQTFWWVDNQLYLKADQETNRAYRWSVRLVRKQTGTDGSTTYVPISDSSTEWTFYWK